jgi:hypothetical protein
MVFDPSRAPSPPGWRAPATANWDIDVAAEASKVLDAAIEKLRWCHEHMHERGVSQEIRQLEARIGYLAQALTWEMDGESRNARGAIRLAKGLPREPTYAELYPYEYDWWNAH